MLKLTPGQERTVRQIQEHSFRAYCKHAGYEEQEHAALLFSFARKKLDDILANVDLKDIDDDEQRQRLEAILKADNFLDLRQAEMEDRRKGYAKTLAAAADRLPIAYEYTAGLCEKFGLAKPEAERPSSIRGWVEAVPLLMSWDWEFNAFMGKATLIDDLPCICIYESLLSACDAFLDCIAPVAINFGSKTRARPTSDCEAMGSESEFMERLHSCLRLLLGESNYGLASKDEIERKSRNTIMAMTEGSVQMVWFHEFGHLLLGHLEQPESHTIEFEADRFALSVIANDTAGKPLAVWPGLGSMTIFILLDIIETIEKHDETPSHPSAKRRIKAALDFWEKANPLVFTAARSFLPSVTATCIRRCSATGMCHSRISRVRN
ncbi:hypothetical protein [Bradyrhizobium jicamae]|nr:hypothetical protein [Bradyrhizobium jicamae]